jgi:hypothetical protein
LDTSTNKSLARSLEAAAEAAPDPAAASLIKSLSTRAMAEAEYFSTGTEYFSTGRLLKDTRYIVEEEALSTVTDHIRSIWIILVFQGQHVLFCVLVDTGLTCLVSRYTTQVKQLISVIVTERYWSFSCSSDNVSINLNRLTHGRGCTARWRGVWSFWASPRLLHPFHVSHPAVR